MGTGYRKTLLAVATTVVLAVTPAVAQTVSQRCVDAVHHEHSEVGAVWVTKALTRGDITELSWSSASKMMGKCTLDAKGQIVDVSVTGRRTYRTDCRGRVLEVGRDFRTLSRHVFIGRGGPLRVSRPSFGRGRNWWRSSMMRIV